MQNALNFFSSRLSGFSTNVYSVSCSGKTSQLSSNDSVILNLPSSSILDCRSVRLAFNLSVTSDAAGRAPANLEKLFSRVEILCGGQALSATVQNHGLLVSMKERVYGSECSSGSHPDIIRAVGDYSTVALGATDSEVVVGTDAASGSACLSTSSHPFVVELTNTFLSSVQPRYLDCSLLNQLQIRLTLNSSAVLSVSANNTLPSAGLYAANPDPVEFDTPITGQSATYEISNLTATCSCISFSSSEYDVLLSDQLASQGYLPCIFKNYLMFRQTHSGSSKFQLSTRSLDRIMFGFLYTGPTTAGTTTVPQLKNSQVINSPSLVPGYLVDASRQASRHGSGMERYVGAWETFTCPSKDLTCQITVNNSFLPQAPAGAAVCSALTEIATGVQLPATTNPLARMSTDFVNVFSLCMPGSDDSRVSSGIDCRGSQVSASLQTTGNFDIGATPSWDSVIVAEFSSELRISVGRSISVVT